MLHLAEGIDPRQERIYHSPRIVAELLRDAEAYADGSYGIALGMVGCPSNTIQVVFLTDDESFIRSTEEIEEWYDEGDTYSVESELAFDLCRVVRTTPVRNVIRSEESDRISGDYRIFAVGLSGSGQLFTASSTLCDALELYYRFTGRETQRGRRAITELRSNDGTEGLLAVANSNFFPITGNNLSCHSIDNRSLRIAMVYRVLRSSR